MTEQPNLQETLDRFARDINRDGPTRVIVDTGALGVSSTRAREEYGIVPDVVFIRNDGWSLGAPAALEGVARSTWANSWIGIMRRPDQTARPYPEVGA